MFAILCSSFHAVRSPNGSTVQFRVTRLVLSGWTRLTMPIVNVTQKPRTMRMLNVSITIRTVVFGTLNLKQKQVLLLGQLLLVGQLLHADHMAHDQHENRILQL